MFRIALFTARELPGDKVDQALADELAKAEPKQAALIVTAMADRPETVKLPAVLAAAEKGPKEVRLAAVDALGRIGNETCLAPLVDIALESDEDLVAAARTVAGRSARRIGQRRHREEARHAQGKTYPLLIELVGTRRIDARCRNCSRRSTMHDKDVRAVALSSLGETVSPARLSVLIDAAVKPKHAGRRRLGSGRAEGSQHPHAGSRDDGRGIGGGARPAPGETKPVLLEILGAVAGTNALHALADAAQSDNDQMRDTSTRLLGEWMTIDAAPVLLELAQSAPADKYKTRAFRGYAAHYGQFIMMDAERIEMCREAFAAGVGRMTASSCWKR